MVPVMESGESGGTIARDPFNLWLIMLNILKDPQNGSISSPQYGYRYLNKRKGSHIFSTEWIPIFE